MANIKSIGGNPIVLDASGIAAGAVTPDKLADMGGITTGAALGITGDGPTESAEWLQRTSTSDGPTTIRSIHGRTLRWNQLANVSGSSETKWGVTTTKDASTGTYTLSGTPTTYGNLVSIAVANVQGHKYLIKSHSSDPSLVTLSSQSYGMDTSGSGTIITNSSTNKTWYYTLVIMTAAVGQEINVTLRPQIFDLTAMFGEGSEPATVAEFEALYPLPYYAYDAGSLLPVNMTGIETTGFNQWDEEWDNGEINSSTGRNTSGTTVRSKGYVPVFSGQTYYFKCPTGDVYLWAYGADKGYIGRLGPSGLGGTSSVANATVTIPATVRFVRFRLTSAYGTTYKGDICINLSDPTRNGEYEPHWQSERSIPAGTLRGAGTVYDELTETERITRVGERAYQSGDESDPTVTTDGTITYYPLTTPTTTPIDPPLNMSYRTAAGGTERVMVPTGELSAPPTLATAQGYTAESLRDAALSAIAPVENGKASTNYAVGSYLVHGGQLCRVTTAIATGEAITIGTNVTATTVMAEVIALIAQ